MNKYFWTWLMSCVCYAAGIIILVIVNTSNIRSFAYLSSEVCQVAALVGTVYACNLIKNIPHNYFALKYGIICMGFFTVYMYYYGVTQGVYVLMLVFKLAAVIMILYIILIKWNFRFFIKLPSFLIFGTSGLFLSLYDFLIYDNENTPQVIIWLCAGIFLLMVQNVSFAVLYRLQMHNEASLKEEYLSEFAENSQDIIFYYVLVPYPRFSLVSPAAETLLGYTPQDFYNNSKLHVEIALEEDRVLMEELLGDFDGDFKDCIVTVESKNGEILNLQCLVTKKKSGSKTVAVEGVFRDVTERIEAERKIAENNKNRQLMLSYISHDLKTPITYIQGYSEAMQKGIISSEEDRKKAVNTIAGKAESLTRLVDDISMLSKLEANRFNYEFEKISCKELARYLYALHIDDFHEGGSEIFLENRQFRFAVEEGIYADDFVIADVKRIEQVFENIFGNAVKATEEGGSILVNCGIARKENSFYVSVTDDGAGISAEDLPHIFENFYRSPQTKKRRGGSGLGLSISNQIIRGHNGRIRVTSEEDRGSCFVFSLPLFTEDNIRPAKRKKK